MRSSDEAAGGGSEAVCAAATVAHPAVVATRVIRITAGTWQRAAEKAVTVEKKLCRTPGSRGLCCRRTPAAVMENRGEVPRRFSSGQGRHHECGDACPSRIACLACPADLLAAAGRRRIAHRTLFSPFGHRHVSTRGSARFAAACGSRSAGHSRASPRSGVDDAPWSRPGSSIADRRPAGTGDCRPADGWPRPKGGWLVAGGWEPGDDGGGRSGLAGLAAYSRTVTSSGWLVARLRNRPGGIVGEHHAQPDLRAPVAKRPGSWRS